METYIIKEVSRGQLIESGYVIRKSFKTVADDYEITYNNCPMHGAFLKNERLENEILRGIKMYGLFIKEKQVGFVAIEKIENDTYEMQKLAVLPEYRHLGYGQALIDFVREYVMQNAGKSIIIGVIEENKILKKWYQKQGFIAEKILSFKHLPFEVGIMKMNL